MSKKLVETVLRPYLCVDRDAFDARGLDLAQLSHRATEERRSFPGIA